MISIRKSILTLALVCVTMKMTSVSAVSTTEEIIEMFKTYDVPDDDTPDCQPESVDAIICPKDETIPCDEIQKIEDHCIGLIGADEAAKAKGAAVNNGENALNGCIKYVGFHVFDLEHMACCPSDHCEDWIEAQFEEGGMFDEESYYEDDDDDDEYYHEGEEF